MVAAETDVMVAAAEGLGRFMGFEGGQAVFETIPPGHIRRAGIASVASGGNGKVVLTLGWLLTERSQGVWFSCSDGPLKRVIEPLQAQTREEERVVHMHFPAKRTTVALFPPGHPDNI